MSHVKNMVKFTKIYLGKFRNYLIGFVASCGNLKKFLDILGKYPGNSDKVKEFKNFRSVANQLMSNAQQIGA